MDIVEFDQAVKDLVWIRAKTMPTIPHEYIVVHRMSRILFHEMVELVRKLGFIAYWEGQPQIYFIRRDHYYWTMGAPVPETIILNRANLSDYSLVNRSWKVNTPPFMAQEPLSDMLKPEIIDPGEETP